MSDRGWMIDELKPWQRIKRQCLICDRKARYVVEVGPMRPPEGDDIYLGPGTIEDSLFACPGHYDAVFEMVAAETAYSGYVGGELRLSWRRWLSHKVYDR